MTATGRLLDRCSRPRRSPSRLSAQRVAFLRRALAWFADRGVQVRAVMMDSSSSYLAQAHRATLSELGLRRLRIKPGRPQTNGKAERFIQTLLNEWACAHIHGSSTERETALPRFLERYNFRRPHGSLGKRAPATRVNNLLRNYS